MRPPVSPSGRNNYSKLYTRWDDNEMRERSVPVPSLSRRDCALECSSDYSLNFLLGVACLRFCSSRMSAPVSDEPSSQRAKKSPRAAMT